MGYRGGGTSSSTEGVAALASGTITHTGFGEYSEGTDLIHSFAADELSANDLLMLDLFWRCSGSLDMTLNESVGGDIGAALLSFAGGGSPSGGFGYSRMVLCRLPSTSLLTRVAILRQTGGSATPIVGAREIDIDTTDPWGMELFWSVDPGASSDSLTYRYNLWKLKGS